MSDIDYTEKIERGLKLFLREEHGITAVEASIGESEMERGWEGCHTCGHGGGEDTVATPIHYRREGSLYGTSLDISGTSLDFLPKLLDYIDRAN